MAHEPIPTTMRAVVAQAFDGRSESLQVQEVDVPQPQSGEVLVQMIAAPINPNDLMFLEDRYMVKRQSPVVVGFEGVGKVVACGGSLVGRALLGRRVACAAAERGGTWAEYSVSPALRCVPVGKDVTDVQAATMLTNPFTAWVLFDRCRREGHRALVQTAAAGALGQMVARLCVKEGFPAIHVVRREAQREALRELGAEHVLDSTAPTFDEELREVAARLGATIGLDPVGGSLSGRILAALPPRGYVLLYGRLANEPVTLDAYGILFDHKRIEGFNMYDWTEQTGLLRQAATVAKVQRHLGDALRVEGRAQRELDEASEAVREYRKAMGEGKIVLRIAEPAV